MEIYWDFLGHARGLNPKRARLQRPAMLAADLRYRGILEMTRKDASSPEIPHYDKVSLGQRWRDLTGYYTRFGDVFAIACAALVSLFVIMAAARPIDILEPSR